MHRNRHGNARAGGQRPGTPVPASAGLWNCTVTQEGPGPLATPAETVHPLRVCTLPVGQITPMIPPCCYLISLCLASVPFLSGGFAARSSTGKVAERIGKEWVIDKSLLDFIFSYLYLYFIVLDFPTSVFPLSDYPTTEMPTTSKRARHVYLCLALYRPYRAEAGVIVQTAKVVNK